jgi:FkbM family methyltransferase
MTGMREFARASVRGVLRGVGLLRANRASCLVREEFEPVRSIALPGGRLLRFAAPNLVARHRAVTLFEKEPETIAWIDGFGGRDVLFDVGANVGTYSIYAGARGHRVIAVEPESGNYALLNRNIALNGLDRLVTAYCAGLSENNGLFELNLSTTQSGNSQHQLGAATDFVGHAFEPAFRQGAVGFTLDALVATCGVMPNHLKIDVDGLEASVLRGGAATIASVELRSILIELNDARPDHRAAAAWLGGQGFREAVRGQSEMTAQGRYADCFNCVWRRERT